MRQRGHSTVFFINKRGWASLRFWFDGFYLKRRVHTFETIKAFRVTISLVQKRWMYPFWRDIKVIFVCMLYVSLTQVAERTKLVIFLWIRIHSDISIRVVINPAKRAKDSWDRSATIQINCTAANYMNKPLSLVHLQTNSGYLSKFCFYLA